MAAPTVPDAALAVAAERYAARLTSPEPPPGDRPWISQSLTEGTAGIALLHIERAHTGRGTWQQAHNWITHAAAGEISADDNTGLYLGAPAIAFILDAAAATTGRYRHGLTDLDGHIAKLAHHRVEAAMARIRRGELPQFREYDVFFGLSGIGALLLRRDPGGSALERVLDYLVALTHPLVVDGQELPGWWVVHDPHRQFSADYPGGHGNFGAAHGITGGPLALLSQAMRRGITVQGQREAINTICSWLDAWRQDSAVGPWWPQWITRADLREGRPSQSRPGRPSWCYGTPGIVRAGQLAAIATGDHHRQQMYEDAFARCLRDPAQQARITDAGLCHGAAGLYQTAWRAARDATTPALAERLPHLADNLARRSQPDTDTASGPGLLEGDAGTALALHTAAHDTAPTSGWDACLLIN
ncbi:lanthionine synthetase C family protein [Acrocarpospora sp. B8E8]|uniref:lanthionine synthetase C family protein n=1 Tax=Acrocarpospora sp. B8E8 TaxID=3153572 RepID=UPI00325D339F